MKRYLPYLLVGLIVVSLIFGLSALAVSCSNAQQNAPVYQNDDNYEDSSYYEDDDIDIHKPKKTKTYKQDTYKHDSYKSRSYGSKRK